MRGRGDRKNLKPRKSKDSRNSKPKTVHHHLYGKIPLVDGNYDPNYKPPLPIGAVPGNVALQEFCPLCHVPHYFYVNEQRRCVQCGEEFIFSAKEQKFWYETLKFNFHSQATRCLDCRKKKRNEKAITEQLVKAHEICKSVTKDPYAKLALAEAVCLYYETYKKGDLNVAIASARAALRLDAKCIEALYWEALAHKLSNREEKARKTFADFLQQASAIPRCKNLCTRAKAFLGL